MKKLNFILTSDNDVICDEHCDFTYDQTFYKFNLDSFKINVKFDEKKFYFKRETNDDIFEIDYDINSINSCIYLKSHNLKIPVTIKNISYDYKTGEIKFSYEIESDEGAIKTILISFEK